MSEAEVELLRSLLPILIPITLIELALMIAALVDLVRRPAEGVKGAQQVDLGGGDRPHQHHRPHRLLHRGA